MSLSSSQLDAFSEVARTRSFSRAAEFLHITQSALSQRIINLEQEISTSLIIREPAGLRLTPAGEELLRYTQAKASLEKEALFRISGGGLNYAGAIRIGAFSSITRSVVMPAIADLVRKNPLVHIELFNRELRELPTMLARNEADFVFTTSEPIKQDIERRLVGHEQNVLIEGTRSHASSELYFDHDPEDQTTAMFFKIQKSPPPKIRRSYLDEIYAIIDAVAAGWGRAVVPWHLITDNKSVRVVKGFKSLESPVYCCFYKQPFYAKLHEAILNDISRNVPTRLRAQSR
jgi:DNA-binding transcriptional LysR family regulator